MINILCFGDSNTNGTNPAGGRWPRDKRWPGILQRLLGEGVVRRFGNAQRDDVRARIAEGDRHAELVLNAMIYQTAKSIGASATVLYGQVDAILLTGGIAHSDYVISRLTERVSFLAPVHVYPGEDELEALALNALGALRGELKIQEYK